MAKRPAKRPFSATQRGALAQPLLDKVFDQDPARPRSAPDSEIDVGPLFVALRLGALDGHLEELAREINDRIAAVEAIEEMIASSQLHVGDKMRLGHNLRPNYLHGRSVTVLARDGEKWLVRLDEPVEGRYANADLRVYATQLEIGTGPE